jgi:hypothetical protein
LRPGRAQAEGGEVGSRASGTRRPGGRRRLRAGGRALPHHLPGPPSHTIGTPSLAVSSPGACNVPFSLVELKGIEPSASRVRFPPTCIKSKGFRGLRTTS